MVSVVSVRPPLGLWNRLCESSERKGRSNFVPNEFFARYTLEGPPFMRFPLSRAEKKCLRLGLEIRSNLLHRNAGSCSTKRNQLLTDLIVALGCAEAHGISKPTATKTATTFVACWMRAGDIISPPHYGLSAWQQTRAV